MGTVEAAGTLICDEEEIVANRWKPRWSRASPSPGTRLRSRSAAWKTEPGIAASVFGPLAEAHINVDMIVQNVSSDGRYTDITFTVPTADYERAKAVLENARRASASRWWKVRWM